jgi:Rrf2 family protein
MAILSQTSEYALRAATVLAQHQDSGPVHVAVLADALDVPQNYLSKTLSQLAHVGVLDSVRGKHGGFRLARPGSEVTLFQIVEPFERFEPVRRCLLGQSECNAKAACPAHAAWSALGDQVVRFLRHTTLADLAKGHTRWPNRAALTDMPG